MGWVLSVRAKRLRIRLHVDREYASPTVDYRRLFSLVGERDLPLARPCLTSTDRIVSIADSLSMLLSLGSSARRTQGLSQRILTPKSTYIESNRCPVWLVFVHDCMAS